MATDQRPISETSCRSCGDPHQYRYCPNCGEKRFDPGSLRVVHFLEEALEGLFHFDNKFFRSVKTLFREPGQLSLDRVEGRTVRAVRPFQLFVIVNVIVFVLPFVNPFSLPLYNYITYRPFINYHTVEAVNSHLAMEGGTLVEFNQVFDHQMHGISKSLLALFIPAHALLFGLLFVDRRRRPMEHLIFATHYITFLLLAFLLFVGLSFMVERLEALGSGSSSSLFDTVYAGLLSITFITWLYLAIRRFYTPKIWRAIITAVVVGGSFFYLLQVYRMVLFQIVLHWAL